jgi:hypothetical protein
MILIFCMPRKLTLKKILFNNVPSSWLTIISSKTMLSTNMVQPLLLKINFFRKTSNEPLGNVYLHSGTDALSRGARETFCAETIPQLLINCKDRGAGVVIWTVSPRRKTAQTTQTLKLLQVSED